MTYTVDGEQYMAIEVGWGGAFALPPGIVSLKFGKPQNISRLLAFKIGGTATLPPAPPPAKEVLNPPPLKASAETVAKGKAIYSRYCGTCHGDSAVGGLLPDLLYSALIGGAEAFDSVVLGGQLEDFGMVSFKNELSKEDADAIRAFIISQANIAKEQQAKK
jgi:alcohol dehydrogenase (cytochrome c)/quinohemoprotein ethanol dehydrogenase